MCLFLNLTIKTFSNFLDDFFFFLIDGPIKFVGIKAERTYIGFLYALKFNSYLTQWGHQTTSKAFANVCVFLQLDENQSHVTPTGKTAGLNVCLVGHILLFSCTLLSLESCNQSFIISVMVVVF